MKRDLARQNTAESFEGLKSDYAAAKQSRYRRKRTGVSPSGSNADYHYRRETDYTRIQEDARDMDRSDVIVGQTIDRAADNILQDGIPLDVGTGDDGLDIELKNRWDSWGVDPEQCDAAGEMCWSEMERMAMRHTFVDGDVIGLPLYDGQIQLVESHRLRTPRNTKRNVILGVMLDELRRRTEYWVTKQDIDPFAAVTRVSDIEPYPTRDKEGYRQVFHVYDPKRVSQTRGVSALAPIFDTAGMFEDINFAKLVQQQVVSCFAVFRERSIGAQIGSDTNQAGTRESESQDDGSTRTIEGIAPGMQITGAIGEKLHGFSPSVPNAEFFQHVRLMLQLIGINLGLPLVLVLLDASETNFSGWRGAVDQARLGFRRKQKSLTTKFHCEVYKWKVRQWMAEDAAIRRFKDSKDVNVFGHRWNLPTWPYIEPLKDAQADLLRLRGGLTSPRRLHADNGREWNTIAKEIVADNFMAIVEAKTKAAELNKLFPEKDEKVHWRELLCLPVPEGTTIDLNPKPEPEPQPASGAKDKKNA
jgi:lambda family phage portal protein